MRDINTLYFGVSRGARWAGICSFDLMNLILTNNYQQDPTCVIWDGIKFEQRTSKSQEDFLWWGQDPKVKHHNATVWQ